MNSIFTEVLVVGGGATGTGIVRDLAMRKFDTILVERGDLSSGTTGRFHGLLHSGGRYAVKDSQSARDCIEENIILKRIMPQCIENTGGLFVTTPEDDPEYVTHFQAGCRDGGIPFEELTLNQMLSREPRLNHNITRCFHLPDASADSFQATNANAESAQRHGAQIYTYHSVQKLLLKGNKVIGAYCHDLIKDEPVKIYAEQTVLAAGAWTEQIAATAGLVVKIIFGKGTLIAVNHRVVNTVINRCRIPTDGDILVPSHTVSIIGTTDVEVQDPDHFSIHPWEVSQLLEQGEQLVPAFSDLRILRSWAGVRPLYKETQVSDTRDISRSYTLLDHETHDGTEGIITIVGGKWTMYRKMAEDTVTLICQNFDVERPCRTHIEPLPKTEKSKHHYLGKRLKEVEQSKSYGQLVCECELITLDNIYKAIASGKVKTIDDVRRAVRLGMGPCQGGYCTYRITGILHSALSKNIKETNSSLHYFLQERWKGLLPILSGQQLRQARFNQLLYLSTFNVNHLPTDKLSDTSPVMYTPPSIENQNINSGDIHINSIDHKEVSVSNTKVTRQKSSSYTSQSEILVIGAGLSGLVCGWQSSKNGKDTTIIAKGLGSTHWHSGCIDVLGYFPESNSQPVVSLSKVLETLINTHPEHPYSYAGLNKIDEAIESLKELCKQAEYPLYGSLETNWLLPSAIGAIRPTCLAPETMIAGDLKNPDRILLVGFEKYLDFFPKLVADNLTLQNIPADHIIIDLPSLRKYKNVTSLLLAGLFDKEEFRSEVADVLKSRLTHTDRIGFPAVLGLNNSVTAVHDLEKKLGIQVFEIPTLPPSVPGIRLHNILVDSINKYGGKLYKGQCVSELECKDNVIQTILSDAPARKKPFSADSYVLATGGILGGGINLNNNGYAQDTALNIPVNTPDTLWFNQKFMSTSSHPIFRSGFKTNRSFTPIDSSDETIYKNLYIAGNSLSNCDGISERSSDGIALATGYFIANNF